MEKSGDSPVGAGGGGRSPSDAQWLAILARSAGCEGNFFYAVRTTGIYCRPGCPSRRPARENVLLFGTPAEARAAGFRACLRCRPEAPHPWAAMVAAACRCLDREQEAVPTLQQLGAALGRSPGEVQRIFKETMGVSPRQYSAMRRAKRLRAGLGSAASVTAAIYDAGYGSPSRVYERRAGSAELGMTPTAYRRKGTGERIRFCTAACPLGRVLMAVTGRGLCAVSLGENDEELIASLRRDFSRAEIERDDSGLSPEMEAVVSRIEEHPLARMLSFDVRATAFQRRVWAALAEIPRGETRSYSEVARAIGQPNAARAVARACGQNPVAVLVPCHRVVGSDGALTGYRWGVERKRRLLEMEREGQHPVDRTSCTQD